MARVYNHTPFTIDWLHTMPALLKVESHWRERTIYIYAHPHKADHLITVGRTWDGQTVVIAEELRDSWAYQFLLADPSYQGLQTVVTK